MIYYILNVKLKSMKNNDIKHSSPLAYRMRPKTLEDYIGQQDVIGPKTPLYNEIKSGNLKSIILYGPAGCGKTSLAEVISNACNATFEQLSATSAGVKEIRQIISNAEKRLKDSQRTILFIDEVHRFNKGQQDVLLPAVEDGTVIFIGATTENPFFSLNSPLISRSRLYILKPLVKDELLQILERALNDKEAGLGNLNIKIESEVLEKIAAAANGDGRRALSLLEISAEQAGSNKKITSAIVTSLTKGPILTYDKRGDKHYDTISAFIKSMRGSDVDAALFWLAKMIESGEDPRFIARRIVIFASEDIGNADPHALMVAVSAAQAVEFVGLPECSLNLTQAVIYLALAPKSNSVIKSYKAASQDVSNFTVAEVPKHLRNNSYKYPHNYPDAQVEQDYRPPELINRKYYYPLDRGIEKKLADRFKNKE